MRVGVSLIIAIIMATAGVSAQSSGDGLFKAKCSMCHIPSKPDDISKLVAPPAMGIAMHVKMAHPDREGFKAFIKDYALNPSAQKALCEKNTIARFNLMPSQKGNVTLEELDKIADYLYDNFAKGKMQGMGCRVKSVKMNGVDGNMHSMHHNMHHGMHHGM